MRVEHCLNTDQWDSFITAQPDEPHSLFQSWSWGEMQKAAGNQIYRLAIIENEVWVGAVLLIVMPLPYSRSYLLSPRGPVVAHSALASETDIYNALIQAPEFQKIMQQHNSIFWRFEPLEDFSTCSVFKKSKRIEDREPSMTTMIDLAESEATLLAAMKQKTRYNIRLAEKKGVEVEFITGQDHPDWNQLTEQFWKLVTETSNRHERKSHPKEYYEAMISYLGDHHIAEIALARHEDDILAMNISMRYGNTTTYVHGAATHHKKQLMAPYLLQWKSIQRAQQAGSRWYDFYGIGPEDPKHKLYGVTKFKVGFQGNVVEYPGTFDFPLSSAWYTLYTIVQRIR